MSVDLYSSVAKPGLYAEYLRRNLLVAKAIGAKASAETALERLHEMKRPPKWLIEALEAVVVRVEPLPADLARWRSLAQDRPDYVKPDAG